MCVGPKENVSSLSARVMAQIVAVVRFLLTTTTKAKNVTSFI